MRRASCFAAIAATGILVAALAAVEEPAAVALKNRTAAPAEGSFGHSVTLAGLLARSGAKDWSMEKAALIEGEVIQVVKSDDGDYRLSLAAKPGEADVKK
ncbi:MAG TPA: hypothetical protein PLS53_05785 [Thermoanaerobaculaceae bacterium]|nr:hypothetical protein [Thermoanaerobaculaceae bacterium]HPS77650.1 hypothetical protein [Thermoanaerobaculaceae bacterium]